MSSPTSRAGVHTKQLAGYRAFIPAPPLLDPLAQMDGRLVGLLSRADQALGRLDGVAQTMPNPDLFVAMYVRREAVLSSQIEGTQSTLNERQSNDCRPGSARRGAAGGSLAGAGF